MLSQLVMVVNFVKSCNRFPYFFLKRIVQDPLTDFSRISRRKRINAPIKQQMHLNIHEYLKRIQVCVSPAKCAFHPLTHGTSHHSIVSFQYARAEPPRIVASLVSPQRNDLCNYIPPSPADHIPASLIRRYMP